MKRFIASVFVAALCAVSINAQDQRTFNYRTMSREQLNNRVNNAQIEYDRAKKNTREAESSCKSAKDSYNQAKSILKQAKEAEKLRKKALKEVQKAVKYRDKLKELSN